MNLSRLVAVILATMVLAGCASLQNTPRQEYGWACVEACKATIPPQCHVTRVDTEGRITGTCAGTVAQWDKDFNSCLREQYLARPYREWLKEKGR